MSSSVLLSGLSPHDAAALELLISRRWPELRCVVQARQADFSLPTQDARAQACELLVLDLAGLGLSQPHADKQEQLLALLQGRPALLLLRGQSQVWAETEFKAPSVLRHLLAPYKAEAMIEAIEALRQSAQAGRQRPAPPLSHATARPVTPARPAPNAPQPSSAPSAASQLLAAIPALQSSRFLMALAHPLPQIGAYKLRFGVAELLLQVQQAQVLATLPISALLRSVQSPQRLNAFSAQALSPQALALELTQQAHRHRSPLELALWELSHLASKDLPLQLAHDVQLQLRRYPNFTLLGPTPPLHLQLAALCLRGPQSLRQLQTQFPGQERQVLQFATLCTFAGIAHISKSAQGPAAAAHPATAAAPAPNAAKRSLFKALLKKLF